MLTGKKTGRFFISCMMAVLLLLCKPIPAFANDIGGVEVWVQLLEDGSAVVTEIWRLNMTNDANTEWYVAKHNLDNMTIQDLKVSEIASDGTAVPFETLARWDMSASRAEKAGKCGLVETGGGYEICWGFGELGQHTYTVSYTITNIVKSYQGGDAMSYNFLSEAAGGAEGLDIYISAEDFALEYPQARVWVFGFEAQTDFTDGLIQVKGQGRFKQTDYGAVLLVLEEGLLSPGDLRSETVDEIIELNMAGSIWEADYQSTGGSSIIWTIGHILINNIGVIILIIIVGVKAASSGKKNKSAGKKVPKEYRDADYCRDLPFQGNIGAAYARLDGLGQMKDGTIIGCFLLQWVRLGQIIMTKETVGLIKKREEDAVRLLPPNAGMTYLEKRLYEMLREAAGPDQVLQSKEFEKWSRQNYSKVGDWLTAYGDEGKEALRRLGACEGTQVSRFFGLLQRTEWHFTPLGEEMTRQMFGFFRYLQDFTIIHEREAVEVQLWDQYLVFAQLYDIADQVADQFKTLYPDFFTQPDTGYTTVDILHATMVSRHFSRTMYQGYRSGVNAASSSSGGGGGSSSSGGGGGASGGGGAGGR